MGGLPLLRCCSAASRFHSVRWPVNTVLEELRLITMHAAWAVLMEKAVRRHPSSPPHLCPHSLGGVGGPDCACCAHMQPIAPKRQYRVVSYSVSTTLQHVYTSEHQ